MGKFSGRKNVLGSNASIEQAGPNGGPFALPLLGCVERNLDRSVEHAAVSSEFSELGSCPFANGLTRLALLQALYEAGKRREAKTRLSRLLKEARRLKSAYFEFNGLLLDAYFALHEISKQPATAATDTHRGVGILRRAMALGREYGIENFSLWRPPVMAFLSVKALEAGIEVDYI